MRHALRFVFVCSLLAPSCSSERERQAPTAPPAPVVSTTSRAVQALGGFGRALEGAKPIRVDGDRLLVEAVVDPRRRTIGAELPARADRPMRVHDANDRDAFWLEVRALDVAPSTASLHDGRGAVLEDVATETDVVHFANDTVAEELRILRGPAASPRARYELTVGPGVASVRLREGRVELVDATGFVRLTSAAMFAIDAKGVERAVAVSLEPAEGGRWALRTELDASGLSYPIVVDPAWTSTAQMNRGRTRHVSFTLNDGRAVAASTTGGDVGTSAEAYTPGTNTWANIANLPQPHDAGAAAVVFTAGTRSGWALVAGDGRSDETGSFYNPSTNTWVKTPALATAADDVSLIRLSDGHRALLVRGNSAAAHVFASQSGASGAWSSAGSMSTIRLGHAAARLPDGTVLVVGGKNGTTVHSSAEIWSPTTNTWTTTTALPAARWGATATLVGGKVLVAGGASTATGNGLRNAWLFDPLAKTWAATGLMAVGRRGHVAALTATGRVLVAGSDGGIDTSTTEVFDPDTGTFRVAGQLSETRPGQRVTVVSTGVLVTGGDDTVGAYGSKASELYAPIANGSACVVGQDCASGACVNGVCCASASCAAGMRCDLAPKKGTCSRPQGAACASAAECASNLCVDGRCCDGACGGQCEACNVAGKEGTCSPVLGAPVGKRTACAGAASSDPCAKQHCDGTDRTKCHYPPAGVVDCSANACKGGVESHLAKCDGAGKCGDEPTSCNPYVCGPTRCKTSCATNADCVAGRYCDTTRAECVPHESLGRKCSDVIPCEKGLFCTNGYCCGVEKCEEGASCGVEGSEGTCTRVNGSACAADAECGSGHCVDGVCCDRACTGQCEACDVLDPTTGLGGKCVPVKGVPHGARTPCEGGGDVCGAKQCDGTTVDACAALVGSDVVCRNTSCVAGVQTLEAKCDGAGACPATVTKPCGGYACTLDGLACETSCTTREQCASGYVCEGGECVEPTARCSDDKKISIAKDGTETACAPYTCRTDGRCGERCATTPECAPGHLCNSGECVPLPAPAPVEDGGGCSVSTSGRSGSPVALLVFAAVFALRRRRIAALASAAISLGCSNRAAPEAGPSDAATASSTPALRTSALQVVEQVRRYGDLGRGILTSNVIVPRGAGLAVEGEQGAFEIDMPARANGTARLVSRRDPSVWLEVRSLTNPSTEGVPVDGAVAYPGERDGEDVVMMPSPGRLEEVRIVRRPAAVHAATYALRVGPGVAEVRLRSGNVEIADAHGYVHFVTERMYAVDARGTTRAVQASLAQDGDGWVLSTTLDAAGLEHPVAIDPAWSAVASMSQERNQHALVPLPDGRVLAIGGEHQSGLELASVEVYDPATNTWTLRASMSKARYRHAAALITAGPLAGRVVVAGGYNGADNTVWSSTAIYNPSTNTWANGPTLKAARTAPAWALLGGSKLFVTSGSTGEVWDTAAGTTTAATNSMSVSRTDAAVVALPTGNALIVGGTVSGTPTALVHQYRAATNDFVAAASLPSARTRASSAVVDGKVLLAGGSNGAIALTSTLLFDKGAWSSTGAMFVARDDGRLVTLSNGRALAIGGAASTNTEIYNPAIGTWSLASFYSRQRSGLEVALLTDGSVVAAGGIGSGKTLANVDRYAPGALGNACTNGNDCLSGFCTNGVCCTTGTCAAGAACNRPKTLGTCTKALGIACATGAECESGSCVDGVCCNTACTGQCEACNVSGKVGTCFPVAGAPVGSRPACATGGSDPCGKQTCDGVDASKCHYLPAGVTKCGTTACSGGVATTAGTCNGAGVCNDGSKSCGAYACAGAACASKCATGTDCAAGFYCDAGTCVPNEGLGQKCSATVPCKSGLACVDGYCCGVASCGEGATCGWFGKEGTCTKVNGTACAADAECGSGHCVDGLCCDSACTGQCEACDVVESSTGRAGRCLPTVGAPHGSRPACPSDPGNECSGSQCGGEDRTTCTVFVGSWKSCRTQSCKDSVLTLPAQCDGKGACPAVVTASCGAYACTADGARCRTSCETSAECAKGYVCVGDRCEKRAAECSEDKASSTPIGGAPVSCAPYLCVDTGACGSSCHSSEECAPGYLCDPSGTCIAPPTATDDGGCAYGRGSGGAGLAGFGLWALACAVVRRRRRIVSGSPRGIAADRR